MYFVSSVPAETWTHDILDLEHFQWNENEKQENINFSNRQYVM